MKNAILGLVFGIMALALVSIMYVQFSNNNVQEQAGISFSQSRLPTIDSVTSTLFGSATGTPITLTAAYVSTTVTTYGQVNMAWDISYTPSSTGSYLEYFVELDRGNGFFPWGVTEITTSSLNVYVGASSTLPGVVVTYPGGAATVGGRNYRSAEFNRTIVANRVRVSVREVTTGGFGTVWTGAVFVPTK